MDSGFPFPEPYVGGSFAEPLPTLREGEEWTAYSQRLARALEGRFDQLQRNQDALGLEFPLSPSLLQTGAVQLAVAPSTLTLTDSPQPVGGTTLTAARDGAYILWSVFAFSITTAGVAICSGEVERVGTASYLPRQALYGPEWLSGGATGEATVTQVNKADAVKGDQFRLAAHKSAAGGDAVVEGSNTCFLMLGPIGPVS